VKAPRSKHRLLRLVAGGAVQVMPRGRLKAYAVALGPAAADAVAESKQDNGGKPLGWELEPLAIPLRHR